MAARRALVTGGRGFIASWLVRALHERGDDVVSLDSESPGKGSPGRRSGLALLGIEGEVEEVRGDLRDRELVGETIGRVRPALVFHLAARTLVGSSARSPGETMDVNVRGTWTVLEACREHDVPAVVVASSDKAYGVHERLPYREELALRPTAPYEASKAAAELIARSYWHGCALPVAVTRFANVYGGGDVNFSRLVPEAVSAALEGRAPILRSDGSPQRDFLYVEDAARAYVAIADALEGAEGRGEAFNAGGERPHSVLEVVQTIARLAGTGLEPEIRGTGNPEGEIERQYVDSSKLRDLTGWRVQVPLEDGLRRTIEWYRAHPEVRAPAAAVSR